MRLIEMQHLSVTAPHLVETDTPVLQVAQWDPENRRRPAAAVSKTAQTGGSRGG
jgi:hypothetical protein